jgi:hypothetical protein
MSGTITPYTFADADRVDIRRYAGYPPYGTGVVIFPEPWVFRYYLAMETRLNNLTPTEGAVIAARLVELRTLEAAIPTAGANLDTDQAAVWKHNANELRDRMTLYRSWRLELCNTLGIPPGPYLKAGGVRLVV